MASVHNVIYQQLRTAGYEAADAKAIIWIAKAAPECVNARKWWTSDVESFSKANIEVLWVNVRKIAARYSLAFLPIAERPPCPLELAILLDKISLLTGKKASL